MPEPTVTAEPGALPAAVLWDMDGTLVDTEPLWYAAEQALAARYGVPWTDADSDALVGMPPDVYGGAMVALGVRAPVEAVVGELVEVVRAALLADLSWQPGVLELLGELVAAGVPCAMVTMSYRSLAEPVAAGAPPGTFAVLVTGDEVTHGKPHPEPYLRAAGALGVAIEDCVAIEDSPPGISSAMASGARTIGVPHMVPVERRPGLSRMPSLAGVRLSDLARVHAGEVLDLIR
ncbi:MAG TPA: HAD family phosphatase [Actinotalea sp.]|nr:HAD family phosphatase [Actinotalea sp.]